VLRQTTSELVGSVGQKDLDMARAMIRTGVTMHSELPGGRMQRLGRMLTTIGQHTSLDEELERINAVTLDDLRSTAADWPLQPVITGRLLPS
jgi:predicted Zn-dependent peptidase